MNRFQKTYIFLFMFSSLGIVGNLELGETIPMFWIVTNVITTILTLGKIIYLELGLDE